MHFFNPAPVQQFVEVIRTVVTGRTSWRTSGAGRAARQEPGRRRRQGRFIANALLFGYLNHAVSMYESRYATREDLDAAMRSAAATRWARWRCST